MNKSVRWIIVIALLLGIALLAGGKGAWADQSPVQSQSLSPKKDGPQTVADRKGDDDCDKGKGKGKDKCKGTVKPPPKKVVIPVTGEYSIGGFCTLSIVLNDPEVTLDGSIQTPLPGELPSDVQRVRQGCLLTYYSSGQRIDSLPPSSGTATICFAAVPGQQTTLYFYDLYSPNPTWVALTTTVKDGIACAAGNASGVYVATFQKH
jgi:hypothetical protein